MAWLAVNKDGTEAVYDYELERLIGLATKNSNQLITYNDMGKSDFWTMKKPNGDFTFGKFQNRIILPKGSIQKLIGRNLTWDDEPVSL